jgi:hypothetical protein
MTDYERAMLAVEILMLTVMALDLAVEFMLG